jgi:hypothetical protein
MGMDISKSFSRRIIRVIFGLSGGVTRNDIVTIWGG